MLFRSEGECDRFGMRSSSAVITHRMSSATHREQVGLRTPTRERTQVSEERECSNVDTYMHALLYCVVLYSTLLHSTPPHYFFKLLIPKSLASYYSIRLLHSIA